MRIAIAGKGGTGKTTISGTLARLLARRGRRVIAVDADSNPNLAALLGVPANAAQPMISLPIDVLERRTEPDGTVRSIFVADPTELVERFGASAPDGVRLLVMGAVGHGGRGCMCRGHAMVRGFVGELVARPGTGADVVVDMEAGLEHLSRGTARHVSGVVAAIEPYYRSMETGRRIAELARELEIPRIVCVANKLRDEEDRRAIRDFCAAHGLDLAAEIPYDASVPRTERAGSTPLDSDPEAPAVRAIDELADRLLRDAA